MPRPRLLFLAEGATMLHFVRPLALAESLDPARYDIHFHAPARFASHLKNQRFTIGKLDTMPGEQFLANLAKGAPLFPSQVIRRYVAEDRELIRTLRPDLVIGDMRLSLPVSARLEQTRCAVLINGYWSPFAPYRSVVPEVPLTRVIPPRWLGGLFRLTEPLAYMVHVRPLNQIRKELGVPPLPPDVRQMYAEGDHVLYADVPEFIPTTGAPANHRYVGPCNWELSAPKPEWWGRMLDDARPKVFVSLGSSGPVRALPALLAALKRLPVSVIVATSGRTAVPEGPGLYSAQLLPFSETARIARVVVSHGGSGGLYPALAAGTPVLGVPANADNHLSTAALVESGAGLGIRVEEASSAKLHRALSDLLEDPRFTQSAQKWAQIYARYDSPTLFRGFLDEILPPNLGP
jgi:UDP:flavonoid glycosyltransferase YjiC (YdhE family)